MLEPDPGLNPGAARGVRLSIRRDFRRGPLALRDARRKRREPRRTRTRAAPPAPGRTPPRSAPRRRLRLRASGGAPPGNGAPNVPGGGPAAGGSSERFRRRPSKEDEAGDHGFKRRRARVREGRARPTPRRRVVARRRRAPRGARPRRRARRGRRERRGGRARTIRAVRGMFDERWTLKVRSASSPRGAPTLTGPRCTAARLDPRGALGTSTTRSPDARRRSRAAARALPAGAPRRDRRGGACHRRARSAAERRARRRRKSRAVRCRRARKSASEACALVALVARLLRRRSATRDLAEEDGDDARRLAWTTATRSRWNRVRLATRRGVTPCARTPPCWSAVAHESKTPRGARRSGARSGAWPRTPWTRSGSWRPPRARSEGSSSPPRSPARVRGGGQPRRRRRVVFRWRRRARARVGGRGGAFARSALLLGSRDAETSPERGAVLAPLPRVRRFPMLLRGGSSGWSAGWSSRNAMVTTTYSLSFAGLARVRAAGTRARHLSRRPCGGTRGVPRATASGSSGLPVQRAASTTHDVAHGAMMRCVRRKGAGMESALAWVCGAISACERKPGDGAGAGAHVHRGDAFADPREHTDGRVGVAAVALTARPAGRTRAAQGERLMDLAPLRENWRFSRGRGAEPREGSTRRFVFGFGFGFGLRGRSRGEDMPSVRRDDAPVGSSRSSFFAATRAFHHALLPAVRRFEEAARVLADRARRKGHQQDGGDGSNDGSNGEPNDASGGLASDVEFHAFSDCASSAPSPRARRRGACGLALLQAHWLQRLASSRTPIPTRRSRRSGRFPSASSAGSRNGSCAPPAPRQGGAVPEDARRFRRPSRHE